MPDSSFSMDSAEAMGVEIDLQSCMSNFLSSSSAYFVWLIKMLSRVCFIWRPRKKLSSPMRDTSNSPNINLENSWHIVSLVEPNITLSTYTWTRRRSFPWRLLNKVLSMFPRDKPLSNKNLLNVHTKLQELACVRVKLFSIWKHDPNIHYLQIRVIGKRKPLRLVNNLKIWI